MHGGSLYGGNCGYSNLGGRFRVSDLVLIVVLFILLIIVGAILYM
ncbi:YjcZ family sporulation protein [Halobacillus ihumii]|nr:YjcZ family sporulation protein [Halobacillus ihumii]